MKNVQMQLYVVCLLELFNLAQGKEHYEALYNKHLNISAEAWPPFLIIYCPNGDEKPWAKDCPNGGEESYDGVLWNLLLFLKEARNVSFTLKQSPDRLWGTCYGINNCTGMVGKVNRGEADFALGRTKT